MKTHYCLELVYFRDQFNLTKPFLVRLYKIVANQSYQRMNRGLSSISFETEKRKQCESIEESVMCTE